MVGLEKKKKSSETMQRLVDLSSQALDRNRQQWKRLLQTDIKLACLLVSVEMNFAHKNQSERFYLTNLNRIEWREYGLDKH